MRDSPVPEANGHTGGNGRVNVGGRTGGNGHANVGGRSIFLRLVATYLVAILVSLGVLGLALGRLLEGYVYRERTATLQSYGEAVAAVAADLFSGAATQRDLSAQVRVAASVTGARIWIVDASGLLLLDFARQFGGGPGAGAGYAPGTVRVTGSELDELLKGRMVAFQGQWAGRFDLPMLSVGVPVLGEGGKVVGGVFLHAPVVGVRGAAKTLLRLVWLAAGLATLVAVILTYVISRSITRPLREMSALARRIAAGDFGRRVAVAGDAELSDLAASLNHMARQLGELEKTRREFIANVSHELRSPLTSMRGFIQGILDGTVSAADRERYLKLAFSETERLSGLIDDLLDLTALDAGAGELKFSPVDLGEVVQAVGTQFEPQARARRVALACDGAGPVAVRADAARLKQILINLVDNALRYTPADGQVRLAWRRAAAWGEVEVRDTGPGIPDADLPHIWDRFYRVDKARTRTRGGTGLGLAIVKRLVEAHNGEVDARSVPGTGAAFTVRLPLAQ